MKSSTDKEALLLLTHLIEFVYRLLWGDLFTLPAGGGIGISLMVVLLFTAGIWFTLRTRLLPVRLFRDMIAAVCEKNQNKEGLSSFQTLVVSTATRVGMGNLVGVVAAVSAGGAGAVFWMWVTALLGASASFIHCCPLSTTVSYATLACTSTVSVCSSLETAYSFCPDRIAFF